MRPPPVYGCAFILTSRFVTAVALPTTGGAVAAAATDPEPSMPAYYLVKWITWKEKKTPIITQSENGPCPLLAIMNTLFLRWKVKTLWPRETRSDGDGVKPPVSACPLFMRVFQAKLPAQTEVVTTEDLMAHLGKSAAEPSANQLLVHQ